MFRRDVGPSGEVRRFSVVGLWGSGNVVADREGLLSGDETAYTMWDGHALFGPGRPDTALEKVGMLLGKISMAEFVSRYGMLGDACEVWLGEEQLGLGCDAACAHFQTVCTESVEADCLAECANQPRALVECLGAASDCAQGEACGAPLPVVTP